MALSGPAAFRELQRRAASARNYVPHTPHPKQAQFLALDCLEALYGGAAGGGKSDALLMAAAQYVHVPGYKAILFRRTYKDLSLPEAIMDRAKEWWRPHKEIHWSDDLKRFTFPSGASISFGYLDSEDDKTRYQSAAFQFVGFDELTQFPKEWAMYLFSRLRRLKGSAVPIRMRSASNPGGIGHEWVKRRYVDGGERGAVFLPAGLADNPSLDAEEYTQALNKLDTTTRKQLLEGIWVRDAEGLVYREFDERRNLASPPKLTNHLLGLDFGIVDQNAVTILGWRENDPCVYVVASYRKTALVSEMADHVAELEATWKFQKIVGDVGGMGKAFSEEMRKRYQLPIEPADKQNKVGYVSLLNGALERGQLKLHPTDCGDLVSEWRELPWNETRTKECEGFPNHASDATLYAWRACTSYHERPVTPPKDKQEAWKRHWEEAEELGESATDRDRLWWQQ